MRIGIIGTAGKRHKCQRRELDRELYIKMIDASISVLNQYCTNSHQIHLISGGAAWSDHIAVALKTLHVLTRDDVEDTESMNMETSPLPLTIYSPCDFILDEMEFEDNGKRGYQENPGRLANQYHSSFSSKVGFNSLEEIYELMILFDVELIVPPPDPEYKSMFHRRNQIVAEESDVLMVFGWSDELKDVGGGTSDTVKRFKKAKNIRRWNDMEEIVHYINLNEL